MSAILNPSIVKTVYEKVLTEGHPSNNGFFLKGVYASGINNDVTELSDRFSKVRLANDEHVEGEFPDATQRVKFLNKIRKLHRNE
ncbi:MULTISPECIES: hypothetical protein [unclassified Neptuniibacter]|uniref:hypothetical protein n=1 Tax=unclassified Neptuniibacter TaxID=2630693 RepID=UPI0025DD739C|nr:MULTISPECIES: hypothetical protein [unclassified Neptuniibacter]|tara:strand:+ start:5412 stop:5666 length:255 start_codon:yes stop_codon:yes gene_type:complete